MKMIRDERPNFLRKIKKSQGFTLIELLISLLIIVLASICTLSYFQYGLGGIHQEGNRRAALEIARGRMDQVFAADFNSINPPAGTTTEHYLTCSGTPCTWSQPSSGEIWDTVTVNEKPGRRLYTKVMWRDDTPGDGTVDDDVVEIVVRACYKPGGSNWVELRSLRAK